MTPIESIYEIESALSDLQPYLRTKDAIVARKARIKYEKLVDRFLRENINFIKPEQRHRCLQDDAYFLALMESVKENYYSNYGDSP